jgi:hypothetical protein
MRNGAVVVSNAVRFEQRHEINVAVGFGTERAANTTRATERSKVHAVHHASNRPARQSDAVLSGGLGALHPTRAFPVNTDNAVGCLDRDGSRAQTNR